MPPSSGDAPGIRYQLDEHIDIHVAHGLRALGIDVITASEAGALQTPDVDVLRGATASGRVIVTADAHFFDLHATEHHAGIAYCGRRVRSVGQIIKALAALHKTKQPADMENWLEFLKPE